MNLETLENLGFDDCCLTEEEGTISVRCSQCEALVINGTPCHERGCPNRPAECRECGSMHRGRDAAAMCCAPCDDDDIEGVPA